MKTLLLSPSGNFLKFVPGKFLLLTISVMICTSGILFAGVKPAIKKYHDDVRSGMNGKQQIKTVKNNPSAVLKNGATAIPPTLSYPASEVYVAGTAISPVLPTTNFVVGAPGYSTSTTTLGSGFNIPAGLAVDAAGNIFIGDQNNNDVKEIPVGTNTPIVIAAGFSTPDGVAVDAQGNIYVANDGGNQVEEIPFVNGGYSAPIVLGGGFAFLQPFDVAVDNKGNVYVADRGNNAVEEIPVGGGATFAIGSGFSTPTGVAVDAFGNVYVADNGHSLVKEIPAGNGTPITLGSGFSNPFTVSVDGSGNVFVADYGNKLVKEIPINGGAITTVGSGYSFIFGVTTDINNNVYVTDYGNNAVKKIQPTGGYYINPALPAGLSFNNATGAISGTPTTSSAATSYTITAYDAYGGYSTTINIAVNAVTMSYASPQIYVAGTPITPLTPTGSGAAAPGYSANTTTLGSGFNIPAGVAVDSKGNIFIGDQNNNVVKEIPGGTGTPITIATGFSTPDGVAVDAAGNIYVADDGNNLIKEIPYYGNGNYGSPVVLASAYTFSQPFDVAVDTQGNVYVADRGHNAVVEIPVGGGAAFTIGSGFATPTGVSADAYGNVYVADNGNSAIKEIPAGNGTPITLGSGFANPFTVSVDGSGNLFVADYGNHLVKEIPINGGAIQTLGSGYSFIFGTAVDVYNNVYVTDYGHNAVKKVQPTGGYYINPALPLGLSFNNTTGTISGTPVAASPATNYTVTAYNAAGSNSTTVNITVNAVTMSYASPQVYVAGTTITPLTPTGGGAAAPGYSANTTTLGSGFNIPAGIAVDAAGNIFIGDQNNNVVKEIPGGTGTPITIATGFATPDGVAVDAAGNVYVADDGNNLIKEIPFTNGVYGTPVVIGTDYTFSQPFDVAVDTKGNVYVADRGHNAVVEIPVGGGASFTIGSGFATPTGVSADAYGNVYVADNGNSAIKEIPAGNGTPITSGSGFANPFTVSVDGSGNLFVADYGNHLIKEIPINGGAIQTLGSGYSFLFGTAVDVYNNVYVTDYGHNAVKKIVPTGGYYINPALPLGLSFNNTTGTISGTPTVASPATNYTITAYNAAGGNSTTINITVNAVTMSYASPQTYIAGTAITPLSPTGGGAAAPGYSVNTTTLGSGFNIPAGIAVDSKGNIFIGDQNNNVVKEIPGGTGTPITIATGFSTPDGVAVDAAGNVYVANDGGNNIQEIPFVNGSYGTPVIIGADHTFSQPFDVAVDTKGNVYVADRGNNAVVEIPVGGGASFVIGSGFSTPTGVAADAFGNVYVADNGNSAVKEIYTNGSITTLGSGFANPFTVAVDGSGNVFVADYGNKLVKEIPINGGAITTLGSGYSFIFGTAVDMYNNVYVTDYGHNAVKKIQPTGGYYINPALPLGLVFNNTTGVISGTPVAASPATNYLITAYNADGGNSTTVNITVNAVTLNYAGPVSYVTGAPITPLTPTGGSSITPGYSISTTTLGSGFNIPAGIAVDAKGNIFIGDQNNNVVKEIPGGTGTPITIATGFSTPDGVAIDAAGNVYVADDGNNLIKEIPFANGVYGVPVVLASAYTFSQPFDVAVDTKGNVYVADRGHNAVVEITPGSTTATPIGSGFSTPTGVAADAYGNVYVADNGNSAVKEIPVAGGAPVTLGSGFSNPFTVAVDGSGNVFVADYGNKLVKEIPINGGAIQTLGSGYSFIFGTAVDMYNNVYVTDYGHNAVKKIQPIGGYYINPALPLGLSFNNTTGAISGTPTVVSAPANYTITAYTQFGGNSTTLNLATTPNYNLSGLVLSNGTLSPAFSPSKTSYSASVGYNLQTFTVTPTASAAGATITVNGHPVTSGTASPVLPLVVGPNLITIVVTASDGISQQTYSLTVNEAHSSNNNLSALAVSTGTLSPAFAAGTTSYSETVIYSISTINITPTVADNTATVKVNGVTVPSGSASGNITLFVGTNNISVVVTAGNLATKTYTITVTRQPSTNAGLSNITLSKGTLSPAFATATTSYTNMVTNGTTSVTLTPTLSNAQATVKVNGTAVASGAASAPITLSVGSNNVSVVVTAQDGVTTKTYTVNVIRPSTNAKLSALTISAGTLTPVFNTNTTSYTASVSNATSSITLTPTGAVAGDTIQVNGAGVISGNPSPAIALNVGPNTITVYVTAQDRITTDTYTVTITRAASSNAGLSNITLSKGSLSPAFATATTSYTDVVTNGTTSTTLTPTLSDPTATVTVNGTSVASGAASAPIALSVGSNNISIVVTAQDAVTKKTYTVTVIRPSTNAKLSNLTINAGTLTPVFTSNTNSYTVSVPYVQSSVKLTPTVAVAGATVTINGTAVASGAQSGFLVLHVGANTLSVVVTAQDGITTDTYTVTVTRAAASTNANLSGITLSKGTLTPAFASGTNSYSAMETNTTTSVTLTPTVADPTATVTINGTAVTSGHASGAITLSVGSNNIPVVVTAQDGTTTNTYTVNVIRPSTNAKLANLITNAGAVTPVFNPATTSYTLSVTNATSSITITPTIAVTGATVKVNGVTVQSGTASGAIALSVGGNTITTIVTAQDGVTTDTYTLAVTRAADPENIPDAAVSVDKPAESLQLADDGINVHQGLSPNGDGINDFLQIDNISQYPENNLKIMNRNGQLVFEAKGYDNATKIFDGHSNKNGQMQSPGTYFYSLDYTVKGVIRHKTGFLVLKY